MKCITTKGFTLIELLVALSVIAILAGLLLPALNSARGKAKSVSCINNYKQLAIAMTVYAGDNNDMLTPLNNASFALADNWWTNLLANGYAPAPVWRDQLAGNIAFGIWRCPEVAEAQVGWGGGCGILEAFHMSTFANSQRLSAFRRPSERMIFADTEDGQNGKTMFSTYCPTCYDWKEKTQKIAARHGRGKTSALALLDGHAEMRNYEDMKQNTGDIFGHNSK